MRTDVPTHPAVAVARLVGATTDGRPLVARDGGEPVAADVAWMPAPPPWARCAGRRALVVHVDGDEGRPVVVALLDAPPPVDPPVPEVLRLAAGRELRIECGEARILLRRDGRVEVRGTHVISRASGPNKVKGGSVHIN